MGESINHSGVIERIDGHTVFVKIVQQAACSTCAAHDLCCASERKEKLIELTDYSGRFHVGETVLIVGETSLGLQAVALAFVLPLLIVLGAVIAGTEWGWEETTCGLVALLLLLPYYYILYLLRDRLKKRFVFTLKKLN